MARRRVVRCLFMVVPARKAPSTRKPSSTRRTDKIVRHTVYGPLLAIAVGSMACAGSPKSPVAGCPKSGPCTSQKRPDDPSLTSLVTAAGDDAVLLAAIPVDPWGGLRKLIVASNAPRELSQELPWITFKHPSSVLRMLLRLPNDSTSREPVPDGWDGKRPMVLALVNGAARSAIEQINAIVFDDANLPIHVRVIVPAVNSAVLGAALEKILVQMPHDESSSAGRYLLDWNPTDSHLAAAVITAKDHVRFELLYFLKKSHQDRDKADMLAQLERTIVAPQPRTGPSVTDHLIVGGHDIVVGIRPTALAQELELESPMKVMAALSDVDPKFKVRILAEGLGEILEGHLLATSGKSEIAEAALAMNFESGVDAVGIAQLTPAGQRQTSHLISVTGTPRETPANALASVAITFQPGGDIKNTEPVLNTYLNGISPQRFVEVFKDAGSAAWPALFAKPSGLWRKLVADAFIPSVIGNLTELPQDVSFELLDVDAGRGPAFRWRGYASNSAASAWSNLARLVAHANTGLEDKEVQQQRGTNGTWITWAHGSPTTDASVPLHRRSDVPKGTFAVARVEAAKIASRLEQVDSYWKRRQAWLLRFLHLLGPINASVRLQGSWLITEIGTEVTIARTAHVFEPPVSSNWVEVVNSTPARTALEQAIADASELMKSFAQASNRAALLSEGHAKLQGILEQAKSDPNTRADAAALDRMLLELEKYPVEPVESKPISDPAHIHCGQKICQVGKETCCGGDTDDAGDCVATVPPGKGDKMQLLASQIEACEKASLPTSTLARCDESLDCRKNEACCEDYLYSGASANFCVTIKRPDRSPCKRNEVCIEGSPCRAPGSVCINGTCQKVVASLPCGTATCTPPNNVCCLDEMRCVAPSECRVGALHCAHHSDCLKGQFCEISTLGTQCTGGITWGVAGSVCDKDADCGPDVFCNKKKPRCLPSEYPGIRNCDCE